jgi:hypothetical protein
MLVDWDYRFSGSTGTIREMRTRDEAGAPTSDQLFYAPIDRTFSGLPYAGVLENAPVAFAEWTEDGH